jgi:hypothetical protein
VIYVDVLCVLFVGFRLLMFFVRDFFYLVGFWLIVFWGC